MEHLSPLLVMMDLQFMIEDAFQIYSNQKDFREKIVSSLNNIIKQRKDQGKDLHRNTCMRKAHFS